MVKRKDQLTSDKEWSTSNKTTVRGLDFPMDLDGIAFLLTGHGAHFGRIVRETVAHFGKRKQIVPGLGHPFHTPVDPYTPRPFQILAKTMCQANISI